MNADLLTILGADTTLVAISNELDQAAASASDLTTQLTTAMAQVQTLSTQVTADTSTITTLNSTISTLQTQLSSAQTAIAQENAEEAAETAVPVVHVFDGLEMTPWLLAPGTAANSNQAGNTAVATQGQPTTSCAWLNLSPNGAYANAYWYKSLGADSSKKHFVYDLSFMFATEADAAASQCVELDIQQVINKVVYNTGVQFNFQQDMLRVWDRSVNQWIATGLPCPFWTPGQWMHIVVENHRDDTHVYSDTITINGKRNVLNMSFPLPAAPLNWADTFNCAVQLDGNSKGTAYKLYLDHVKFTASS